MSDERELKEQLVLVRDLFRKTGAVHEALRVQLAYLPRVCIEHATSTAVTVQYVPERPSTKKQVRVVAKVQGREPKDLAKRLKHLDKWLKFLLGEDFEVVVKYGSKTFIRPGGPLNNGLSPHHRTV